MSLIDEKPKLSIFQYMLVRRGLVAFLISVTVGVSGLLWWAQDEVPITRE